METNISLSYTVWVGFLPKSSFRIFLIVFNLSLTRIAAISKGIYNLIALKSSCRPCCNWIVFLTLKGCSCNSWLRGPWNAARKKEKEWMKESFPYCQHISNVLKFLACLNSGTSRVPPQVLASGRKACGIIIIHFYGEAQSLLSLYYFANYMNIQKVLDIHQKVSQCSLSMPKA